MLLSWPSGTSEDRNSSEAAQREFWDALRWPFGISEDRNVFDGGVMDETDMLRWSSGISEDRNMYRLADGSTMTRLAALALRDR